MNDFTEKDRIEQFSKLMNKYIPDGFTEWLIENGFFTAPASIHHHGAYSGALFDHSFAVTKALLSLTERLELKWERESSPHNVGAALLPGHGEKSVMMLQQHIALTEEEMFCIRWHMGAFDDKENWNSYGRSVTNYPNVLYTHTADMIAARILGI
jgi:hypothetical protein